MPHRTEHAASTAMGAIKTAKAAILGLTGVFRHLAREHGEVSALLMRVKLSSDVAVRRDLFPKIKNELLSHEKGELREVYAVLKQYSQLQDIVEEHDSEANELEQLIDKLSVTPYDGKDWKNEFDRLVEKVNRHVKKEENDYFPAAMRVIGKEESERMLPRYQRAKAELMQKVS